MIRFVDSTDVVALTDIINHYVEHTPITFDERLYTPATRQPWVDQFTTDGPHRCFVAESNGSVIGWAASVPYRAKDAYRTTVETSIYLAPDATKQGIGTSLYRALFDSLEETDLHLALAGITVPNAESVALHEKFGFRHVGTFREVGKKFDRYWDVAWFAKPLR